MLLLIKIAGGNLRRTDLQKLLFLVTREQVEPQYDFVPYKFGCFSFQAAQDLEILQRLGWLHVSENEVCLKEQGPMRMGLPPAEVAGLSDTIRRYQHLRGKPLVRVVYCKYPYFAINSEIAREVLDDEHYGLVVKVKARIKQVGTVLFTIGYEGSSFENYVNKLIQNDVRLLCDVRQNPVSRKFGFSKKSLSVMLPKLGIDYMHIPELGIGSEHRAGLETSEDFRALFDIYRANLPNKQNSLEKLCVLVQNNKRVALTCFEQDYNSCHRHCISDALSKHNDIAIVHL